MDVTTMTSLIGFGHVEASVLVFYLYLTLYE